MANCQNVPFTVVPSFSTEDHLSPIREASAAVAYGRSQLPRPSNPSSPRSSSDSQATLVNPRQAPPPPAFQESPPPSYSSLIRLNDIPSTSPILRKQKSGKFAAFCGALKADPDLSSFDDFIHPKLPKKLKPEPVQVSVEVVKEEFGRQEVEKKQGSIRRKSILGGIIGRRRGEPSTGQVGVAM